MNTGITKIKTLFKVYCHKKNMWAAIAEMLLTMIVAWLCEAFGSLNQYKHAAREVRIQKRVRK